MLGRVALARTDVLEENIALIITVTRIDELGTTLAVAFLRSVLRLPVTANVVPSSPILVTLMMGAVCSSETSVLTRATWYNIPENDILHAFCNVRKPVRKNGCASHDNLVGWTWFIFGA
jgi:hypothetical protein